jgi:hypothetical protein
MGCYVYVFSRCENVRRWHCSLPAVSSQSILKAHGPSCMLCVVGNGMIDLALPEAMTSVV